MTPLRQRMIEDLQLRGLSARTQERSVRAVRPLAEHDPTSPARSTEDARRASCLSLKNVTHASRSASTIALCGLTFCSEHTRKRAWTLLPFVRPPQEHTLPVILRLEDVHTHPPGCAVAALSRRPAHALCLWPAGAGRHPPAGARY
jgi:hypothetical protein